MVSLKFVTKLKSTSSVPEPIDDNDLYNFLDQLNVQAAPPYSQPPPYSHLSPRCSAPPTSSCPS
eukprot:1189960-Prorocentrum_minimum.AAC.1